MADGDPGHLLVRGPSIATGYWGRYDESRKTFQGEWLRTGDVFRRQDGHYHHADRAGDMLQPGGVWVSPRQLEECLQIHPAVTQAVVVAGRDADGLEKAVAFVRLDTGKMDRGRLRARADEALAGPD